jgi:type V secretory pathway adhesin AidA
MRPAGRKPWLQSVPHSVAFNKSARGPLWLNPSFSIEPQAYPIWQNSRFEQAADPFSTVIYQPADIFTGRLGLRVQNAGTGLTTFNITALGVPLGRTSLEVGGGRAISGMSMMRSLRRSRGCSGRA